MSLRFAIIGCGLIAEKHAIEIKKNGILAAVCDINKQKVTEFASKHNSAPYFSIEEMLADNTINIDIVSVCTPNGLHYTHTVNALNAGKNVLCEKPMSIKSEDAKEMIRLAATLNKQLIIVKSARYNPILIRLKKLIENGDLGKICSFSLSCCWNRPDAYYANSWRGTRELDGGILFTQFSHYIDIIIWLFGQYSTISGFRKNFLHTDSIQLEDTGVISLKTQNGIIGSVHYTVNAAIKNQEIALNIIFEKATVQLGGEYMNKIIYQNPVVLHTKKIELPNPANDYGFYKGSMSNHDKVYENVINALNGRENNITDGSEALKTVQFIEAFYKTATLF